MERGRSIWHTPGSMGWLAGTLELTSLAALCGLAWIALAASGVRLGVWQWLWCATALGFLVALPWCPTGGSRGLGLANCISISRWLAAAPLAVFLLAEPSASPFFVCFLIGVVGLSDMADGRLATLGRRSQAGGGIDPIADGASLGGVAWALWLQSALPGWLAAVVMTRYAVPALAGAWLLWRRGGSLRLEHTWGGRVATAAIVTCLGAVVLGRLGPGLPASVIAGAGIVCAMATVWAFADLGQTSFGPESDPEPAISGD